MSTQVFLLFKVLDPGWISGHIPLAVAVGALKMHPHFPPGKHGAGSTGSRQPGLQRATQPEATASRAAQHPATQQAGSEGLAQWPDVYLCPVLPPAPPCTGLIPNKHCAPLLQGLFLENPDSTATLLLGTGLSAALPGAPPWQPLLPPLCPPSAPQLSPISPGGISLSFPFSPSEALNFLLLAV